MSYADWEYQDFAELKKYEIRANVKCIAQNKVTTCFGEIKHKYLYIEFISTRSIKYNHAWRKIKKGMYQLSPLPVSLQHQPFAVLLKQDVLHPENYYKVYGCLKLWLFEVQEQRFNTDTNWQQHLMRLHAFRQFISARNSQELRLK